LPEPAPDVEYELELRPVPEQQHGGSQDDEARAEVTPPHTGSVAAFVAQAFSIVGSDYQWSGYTWTGDVSSSAFTCSGVIDFALGNPSQSNSPEMLYEAVADRLVTDISQLSYGDLVFYSYAGRYPGHVGIYVGSGAIIDSIPDGGVAVRSVDYMDFIGGGSYF
jgi:cell wall-associated NlpC family hydrolase